MTLAQTAYDLQLCIARPVSGLGLGKADQTAHREAFLEAWSQPVDSDASSSCSRFAIWDTGTRALRSTSRASSSYRNTLMTRSQPPLSESILSTEHLPRPSVSPHTEIAV